jgi:Co/Zn/Cd efflux system component
MVQHDNHDHGHSHEHSHSEKKTCSKVVRLSSMLSLIFIFFFLEIIVGHITHSLTLIADSFHMLSDFVALCIALLSVWVNKILSKKFFLENIFYFFV